MLFKEEEYSKNLGKRCSSTSCSIEEKPAGGEYMDLPE